MLDQVGKAFVLSARLDVPGVREIEKVLMERRAIGIFPTGLDRANDCNEFRRIAIGLCTRRQQ